MNELHTDLYEKFLKEVTTKQDLLHLKHSLQDLKASLYSTELDLQDKLGTHLTPHQKEFFLKLLQSQNIDPSEMSQMERFIETIIAKLNNLPIESLTLGTNVPDQTVERISKWFNTQFNQKIILDISIDHTIIGGLIISSKGKYNDYSVRKKLENTLLERSVTESER